VSRKPSNQPAPSKGRDPIDQLVSRLSTTQRDKPQSFKSIPAHKPRHQPPPSRTPTLLSPQNIPFFRPTKSTHQKNQKKETPPRIKHRDIRPQPSSSPNQLSPHNSDPKQPSRQQHQSLRPRLINPDVQRIFSPLPIPLSRPTPLPLPLPGSIPHETPSPQPETGNQPSNPPFHQSSHRK